MKKIIFFSIVMTMLLLACHKKAVPVITERTVEPPPPAKTEEPVIAERTVEPPPPPKPPEPVYASPTIAAGREIYMNQCRKCHDEKPVGKWTQEEWKPILRSMVKKSKLNFAETAQVTAYVNEFAKKN